jgi:hypothetical protein
MATEQDPISEESKYSSESEDPQKRKLLLEIRQLERPWLKQIIYAPTFLPTMIAVITLSLAFWTGLFDVKRERLLLDITRFETEKNSILAEKNNIIAEYNYLKAKLDSVEKFNLNLTIQNDSLSFFAREAIVRLKKIDQLATKIPLNYSLTDDDGKPLMTEGGKLILTEDHPIIMQLRTETKALQKLFDKSLDKTFE